MGKLLNNVVLLTLMLLPLQSTFAADAHNADVKVTNAFFYVPVGTSKATMAFFTITNNSNSDLRVTGVNSRSAKQVLLMPESVVLIPAHQTVALKSSGRYLQINGLKGRLGTGDELHLDVSLSNGQHLEIIALAKSAYDQVHGH